MIPLTPLCMHSLPALRWLMQFDQIGATHLDAAGGPAVRFSLERFELAEVYYYRRFNPHVRRPRRFQKITRGSRTAAFADAFRAELRQRNLATINGHDDGLGRVAFNADWRTRRLEIISAAETAWVKVSETARPSTGSVR